MRFTSYMKAFDSCVRDPRPMYRIDVVMFNLVDGDIDGEYYECDGDSHPFECFFDDKVEAIAYIEGFTADMAQEAIRTATNRTKYENVAVEVNELDEGFNPGYVVAYGEWMGGTEHNWWCG